MKAKETTKENLNITWFGHSAFLLKAPLLWLFRSSVQKRFDVSNFNLIVRNDGVSLKALVSFI